MLFSSGAELFEGDTIACSFSLPGSGSTTAEAEIVRIIEKESKDKQNLYGISFTDPDNNLISAIEQFITKKIREISAGASGLRSKHCPLNFYT